MGLYTTPGAASLARAIILLTGIILSGISAALVWKIVTWIPSIMPSVVLWLDRESWLSEHSIDFLLIYLIGPFAGFKIFFRVFRCFDIVDTKVAKRAAEAKATAERTAALAAKRAAEAKATAERTAALADAIAKKTIKKEILDLDAIENVLLSKKINYEKYVLERGNNLLSQVERFLLKEHEIVRELDINVIHEAKSYHTLGRVGACYEIKILVPIRVTENELKHIQQKWCSINISIYDSEYGKQTSMQIYWQAKGKDDRIFVCDRPTYIGSFDEEKFCLNYSTISDEVDKIVIVNLFPLIANIYKYVKKA